MIHIITLSNPQLADMFVNYMATKGVRSTQKQKKINKSAFWLENEQQLNQVESELKPFVNLFTLVTKRQVGKQVRLNVRVSINIARLFFNQKHGATIRPFNGFDHYFMCARLYLAANSGRLQCHVTPLHGHTMLVSILNYGVISPQHLFNFSLMHIAFNLAMWWYLASQTEKQLGTGKLFVIMLIFWHLVIGHNHCLQNPTLVDFLVLFTR